MYAVVTVFTAAVVGSTVAILKCDDAIIEKLKTEGDCYKDGKAPKLKQEASQLDYRLMTLGKEIPISDPNKLKCANREYIADHSRILLNFYQRDSSIFHFCEIKQKYDNIGDGYILETIPNPQNCLIPQANPNAKYKLYPIHNESGVYSYYRCTEDDKGSTSDVFPSVAVAVRNGLQSNQEAFEKAIEKAKNCFHKLDIKPEYLKEVNPCVNTTQ